MILNINKICTVLLRVFLTLHGHIHSDLPVRLVAQELEVRGLEAVDVLDVWVHTEHGEGPRRPFQLCLQWLDVVVVHMRVAHRVDEFARLEAAHLRHHARQERVGGDVEGHAETHIARTLIH